MKAVILCGGKGTRAYPYTEYMPKALMPVNGQPILVNVMEIYAHYGYKEFVLSLGWHKDVIVDYFRGKQMPWQVELVDTGPETDTGGRITGLKEHLGDQFMLTYTDGLSDVPINDLVAFHNSHQGLVTMTTVPLRSQYGTVEFGPQGRVVEFLEKPLLRSHWINAGFFVLDREVFDHWEGSNFEKDVLPALAAKGLVYAYQHDGFFRSMDTYKDQQEIEQMCQEGKMPWRKASTGGA